MVVRSTIKKKAANGRSKKTSARAGVASTRPGPVASLEILLDHLPGGVITLDREGRIQHMNMEARSLLGRPADGLRLEDWPQTFGLYQDDDASFFPIDRLPPLRALKGEDGHFEEMILRPNGDARQTWILMTARPTGEQDGLPQGATAFIREITERKQTEMSRERYARRIETFYRLTRLLAAGENDLNRITSSVAVLAAEALGDLCNLTLLNPEGDRFRIRAFHDTDPHGRALFQAAFERGIDYPRERGMSGQVIRTGEPLLLPSLSRDELLAMASPEFKPYVQQVRLSSALVVPIIGRSGILGTINMFRHAPDAPYNTSDQSFLMEIGYRAALAIEHCTLVESLRAEISARKTFKQELDKSQERFRSILQSTALGLKVLDLDGTIADSNPAYQHLIGYQPHELAGRNFFDFVHPEDVERARQFFNDMKTSDIQNFRFEHRIFHKNGSILWVKTTFTSMKKGNGDDSPAYIFGILENITEQKKFEAEMAELQKRLQSSVELERLRVARELHDGPMQELYSAMYRLKQLAGKAAPELGPELDSVNRDIQRVLQDLRATAKELRPPAISNFGLEKAIRSHAEDFQQQHPDVKLHLELAQDRQLLPEEMRLALFRVFQQSMSNVIQHSRATEVWVHFAFDAEQIQLQIKDNGVGFNVPPTWINFVREGHYGLAGAAERMIAVGGNLVVESRAPGSTLVNAVIPVRDSLLRVADVEEPPIVRRARDLI